MIIALKTTLDLVGIDEWFQISTKNYLRREENGGRRTWFDADPWRREVFDEIVDEEWLKNLDKHYDKFVMQSRAGRAFTILKSLTESIKSKGYSMGSLTAAISLVEEMDPTIELAEDGHYLNSNISRWRKKDES